MTQPTEQTARQLNQLLEVELDAEVGSSIHRCVTDERDIVVLMTGQVPDMVTMIGACLFNLHKQLTEQKIIPNPTAKHAEVGAINAGCDTLYITYQPCPDCAAKMIEARTVHAVYYRDQDSKASTESIELLRGAGIYVSDDWLK